MKCTKMLRTLQISFCAFLPTQRSVGNNTASFEVPVCFLSLVFN